MPSPSLEAVAALLLSYFLSVSALPSRWNSDLQIPQSAGVSATREYFYVGGEYVNKSVVSFATCDTCITAILTVM